MIGIFVCVVTQSLQTILRNLSVQERNLGQSLNEGYFSLNGAVTGNEVYGEKPIVPSHKALVTPSIEVAEEEFYLNKFFPLLPERPEQILYLEEGTLLTPRITVRQHATELAKELQGNILAEKISVKGFASRVGHNMKGQLYIGSLDHTGLYTVSENIESYTQPTKKDILNASLITPEILLEGQDVTFAEGVHGDIYVQELRVEGHNSSIGTTYQ